MAALTGVLWSFGSSESHLSQRSFCCFRRLRSAVRFIRHPPCALTVSHAFCIGCSAAGGALLPRRVISKTRLARRRPSSVLPPYHDRTRPFCSRRSRVV